MMKGILLLCLLISYVQLSAQKIRTVVPRQKIISGNAFQIQYIIPGEVNPELIHPPISENVQLISGPNLYKGREQVAGKTTTITNVTFTLLTTSTGRVKIPSATLKIGKEELRTDAATVVAEAPGNASFQNSSNYTDLTLYAPDAEKDLEKLVEENLFVRAEVDKQRVYIGEPIVATFKLYSRLQSTSEVTNSPSLYGFTVTDMLNTNEAHTAVETVKGRIYNTAILRKLQLFPEQAGKLEIDAMELKHEIEFENRNEAGNKKIISCISRSPAVAVHIKPLPSIQPPAFTGAVGSFEIMVLSETQLHAAKQGYVQLRVQGTGNFIQLVPPTLAFPKNFEAAEPITREALNRSTSPLSGHIDFLYPVIPDTEGSFLLPPVQLVYFDPSSGEFRNTTTDSIRLLIGKADLKPQPPAAPGSSDPSVPVMLIVLGVLLLSGLLFWIVARKKHKTPVDGSLSFTERIETIEQKKMDPHEKITALLPLLSEMKKKFPGTDTQIALIHLQMQSQQAVQGFRRNTQQWNEIRDKALSLARKVEGKRTV